MKKVRVHIIERFSERTLALSNTLDEASADKFVNDFYKYFHKSPVVDIDVLIEEDDIDIDADDVIRDMHLYLGMEEDEFWENIERWVEDNINYDAIYDTDFMDGLVKTIRRRLEVVQTI